MQDFRKLAVWTKAYELALDVYKATAKFPMDERFGLRSQLRRAAVSVAASIAEGCGRSGRAELRRFLQIAAGSSSEVECELLLARGLSLLTTAQHGELERRVLELKRMLTGLMNALGPPIKTDN